MQRTATMPGRCTKMLPCHSWKSSWMHLCRRWRAEILRAFTRSSAEGLLFCLAPRKRVRCFKFSADTVL
ncbi:unnamed protein product [Durusdinium trenchii]|uniref:Uncharacterized protein n=1 Tax=Durusdinium trenchii TaxID=1381693 RepID=A0ABP0IK95_9DINO